MPGTLKDRPSRAALPTDRTANPRANPERSRLYSKFVPAYEAVWPLIVKKRVHRSIDRLGIAAGEAVLEIGIGTGLSMPAYPRHAQVTGIDLSDEMLDQARQKIARKQWDHICVQAMNAQKLDYPDHSFDYVTAFHVVSVVSDPGAMMSEMARVLKPGGRALVINHFRSDNFLVANLLDRADPLTRHLGWRTNLGYGELVDDLPLRVSVQRKRSPLSLFTILHATRI